VPEPPPLGLLPPPALVGGVIPCCLRQARNADLVAVADGVPGAAAAVEVEVDVEGEVEERPPLRVGGGVDRLTCVVVGGVGDGLGAETVVTTPLAPDIVVRLPPPLLGVITMLVMPVVSAGPAWRGGAEELPHAATRPPTANAAASTAPRATTARVLTQTSLATSTRVSLEPGSDFSGGRFARTLKTPLSGLGVSEAMPNARLRQMTTSAVTLQVGHMRVEDGSAGSARDGDLAAIAHGDAEPRRRAGESPQTVAAAQAGEVVPGASGTRGIC
jgi:hypothetical protein